MVVPNGPSRYVQDEFQSNTSSDDILSNVLNDGNQMSDTTSEQAAADEVKYLSLIADNNRLEGNGCNIQ